MESTDEVKVSERQGAFLSWLSCSLALQSMTVHPMQGDASFRRYFRVYTQNQSFVAMDAPPPQENCRPFAAVSHALRQAGLEAPEIVSADLEQGFLLLTDFGDQTYLKALTVENADLLYESALKALAKLQNITQVEDHLIPAFTQDFMQQEWRWHKEWFLEKWLGLSGELHELDACFAILSESAASQPPVFMHRDYHSANLMVLPLGKAGILDFQDAFIGPLTYDLVSLLRDCYINWPDEKVTRWALYYRQLLIEQGKLPNIDEGTFLRWFDLMGLERHLKALFTFSRKAVRDHQMNYLNHVPRTIQYIERVSAKYPELDALHTYYTTKVKTMLQRKL